MSRRCERPDCAAAATVAYGFDASQRMAWFADLVEGRSQATTGALCKRHAAAMVLPRGWWLDDRRSEADSALFARSDLDPADDVLGTVAHARRGTGEQSAGRRASRRHLRATEQPDLGFASDVRLADVGGAGETTTAAAVAGSGDVDLAASRDDTDVDLVVGASLDDVDDSVDDVADVVASDHNGELDRAAPVVDAAAAGVDAGAREAIEDGDDDGAAPIPWMPAFDQSDDLDGLLDARSPLLARAFRGRRRSTGAPPSRG